MPFWIHRTTKQSLRSVPSADLPEAKANYIEEPDLSAVTKQDGMLEPSMYWIIPGDDVSLMDTPARNTVDDARVAAQEQADKKAARERMDTDKALIAIATVGMNETNIVRVAQSLQKLTLPSYLAAIKNEIDNQ